MTEYNTDANIINTIFDNIREHLGGDAELLITMYADYFRVILSCRVVIGDDPVGWIHKSTRFPIYAKNIPPDTTFTHHIEHLVRDMEYFIKQKKEAHDKN